MSPISFTKEERFRALVKTENTPYYNVRGELELKNKKGWGFGYGTERKTLFSSSAKKSFPSP